MAQAIAIREHFINYPDTRIRNRVVFKLNSDDYSEFDIRKVGAAIRQKNLTYKYHRQYSKTKLMSWGVFTIIIGNPVSDEFCENFTKNLLNSIKWN